MAQVYYYYDDTVRRALNAVVTASLVGGVIDWGERVRLRRKEMEDYKTADAVSMALFESHLNPDQRSRYMNHRTIPIIGNFTGRMYLLSINTISGNIFRVAKWDHDSRGVIDGQLIDIRFCFYIEDRAGVPRFDHFLAQKLMIERCESEFLNIAVGT